MPASGVSARSRKGSLLIGLRGCYAGRFFRYRARFFAAPKWLFFTENCGFVLTIAALFSLGSSALLTAPLVVPALVLGTAAALRLHQAGAGRSVPERQPQEVERGRLGIRT